MPSAPGTEAAQPVPRIMYGASEPAFQALRRKMESDWTPAMMRMLNIDRASLPVICDTDFLYGPKTRFGEDTSFSVRSTLALCSLFRTKL
jgi:hypothetical protein